MAVERQEQITGDLDALDDAEGEGPARVVGVHVDGLVGRERPLTLALADDHPVLLTGSSGSGKSTLLRGIHAIATGNFPLLATLPLRGLRLERAGASDIVAKRTSGGVKLTIGANSFDYHVGAADPTEQQDEQFGFHGLARLLRMEGSLMTRLAYDALRAFFANEVRPKAAWLIEELADLSIPYVADDRLFALADLDVPSPIRDESRARGMQAAPSRSTRSVDLVGLQLRMAARDEAVKASRRVSQIDRELPDKVIAAARGGSASAEQVQSRVEAISALQRRLEQFGLGAAQRAVSLPEGAGDERERAVLLAVLDSYHAKLDAWTPFLEDLERFVDAVNRRFRRKHLEFSTRRGLRVRLDEGPALAPADEDEPWIELNMLSSGEQHLVVLLHQLIFGSPKGSLFLVDEPELSLHVAWQRELASDLADIAIHKESRYLIATHSPSVIAGHLDWEINFDDLGD